MWSKVPNGYLPRMLHEHVNPDGSINWLSVGHQPTLIIMITLYIRRCCTEHQFVPTQIHGSEQTLPIAFVLSSMTGLPIGDPTPDIKTLVVCERRLTDFDLGKNDLAIALLE